MHIAFNGSTLCTLCMSLLQNRDTFYYLLHLLSPLHRDFSQSGVLSPGESAQNQTFRFETRAKDPVSLCLIGVYIQNSVGSAVITFELDPVILAPYQVVGAVFSLCQWRKWCDIQCKCFSTCMLLCPVSVNILHCSTRPVFPNGPLCERCTLIQRLSLSAIALFPDLEKTPITLHSPVELLCSEYVHSAKSVPLRHY